MEATSMIFVNTPMPEALEIKLRVEAARRRVSRAELVRRAVIQFLALEEKEGKNERQPV